MVSSAARAAFRQAAGASAGCQAPMMARLELTITPRPSAIDGVLEAIGGMHRQRVGRPLPPSQAVGARRARPRAPCQARDAGRRWRRMWMRAGRTQAEGHV
jgi:hypothetical protein